MATVTFEEIPGEKFWEGPEGQIGSLAKLDDSRLRVTFHLPSKIDSGKFVEGPKYDFDSGALVALMEFFVKRASEIASKERT